MLVATRDPLQQPGHDASSFHYDGHGARRPRLGRAIAGLQIVGTLLGIPVGLASVYSMYHANFSVEATCQALRTNIVSMIDKKIDPVARRMLVRREVETFEKSCGSLDPDAGAAFKALLAAEKAPAPAAPAVAVAAPQAQSMTKPVATEAESHSAPAAKKAAVAKGRPAAQDTAASDARWLEAVRGALVTAKAASASGNTARSAAVVAPARAANVSAVPAASPVPTAVAPKIIAPMPAAPISIAAPALPPATAVATVPAQPPDADHPVPPASIPEAASDAGVPANHSWLSQLPLVGSVVWR